MSQAMAQCIADCNRCHQVCLGEAMQHCLAEGGDHVEQNHLRLMLDCARLCQVCADFMISGDPLHHHVCRACAAICQACADSCAAIPGMEACADTCRRCGASCAAMAA